MKASLLLQELVIGIPITSAACDYQSGNCKLSKKYLCDSAHQYNNSTTKSKQSRANSVLNGVNKLGRTVKGKITLGARILQVGGLEKVFMKFFSVREEERLLKASQCYLSTTSGPIGGLLFISTHKLAFCSDSSVKISCPNAESIRVQHKVSIPLERINFVNQNQNVKKPSAKYIEIVTVDNFDFWFMGFLNYKETFKRLQQAVSQA